VRKKVGQEEKTHQICRGVLRIATRKSTSNANHPDECPEGAQRGRWDTLLGDSRGTVNEERPQSRQYMLYWDKVLEFGDTRKSQKEEDIRSHIGTKHHWKGPRIRIVVSPQNSLLAEDKKRD